MMIIRAVVLGIVVAVALTGCADEIPEGATDMPAAEPVQLQEAFLVNVSGVISDTLSGEAAFGLVMDPGTRTYRFVISLRAGFGLGGGIFIVRSDTTLPQTGTYRFEDLPREELTDDRFFLVYRHGLIREFRGVGGSVTLTSVTENSIEGTINARLRGRAYIHGRWPEEGDISITGSFAAVSGGVGYILGL
jgi:hypothetical protein